MRILIISQWYLPIKGAAAMRLSKMAEAWKKQGHQVTVLTGFPSYPTGILPRPYHWKLWRREAINRVNVLRTYEYPSPNRGLVKRLLNQLTFLISATIALLYLPRQDVVLVSSPPFLSGLVGLIAKNRWKVRFYFDIRDLWPDSAFALGYLSHPFWRFWLLKLERKYYREAEKIFTATPSIKSHLDMEHLLQNKTRLLLNSVDTEQFRPRPTDRRHYGFNNDDFIISYIGNLGVAQKLEVTLRSAKILSPHPTIKFLFVGEGEEKEKLMALSHKMRLKNVIFWPEKKHEEIPKIINLSDLTLVSLAPQTIFQQAIPSKTLEYLACAKPVLAAVEGSLKEVIEKYEAGVIFPANSSQKEAKAILQIYQNPALRQKMSRNARKLATKLFSLRIFEQELVTLFKD